VAEPKDKLVNYKSR
jgi:hypothetical protein